MIMPAGLALDQSGQVSLLEDLAGDEIALLIEMVVRPGIN
jgi:hypothetical protein